MANPADTFKQVQNNFYQSTNKSSKKRLDATLDRITTLRACDAIITALDPDYANVYTVDVYERTLALPPTRKGLTAVCVDPRDYYVQWSPCRVVVEGSKVLILGGMHMFGLYVTDAVNISFRNRVQGYPSDINTGHDASITNKIYINFQYPDLSGSFGPFYNVGDFFAWIKYPQPIQPSLVNPPTLGFVIQSAGLPTPTSKYQVYSPIDDSLIPTWVFPRFHG